MTAAKQKRTELEKVKDLIRKLSARTTKNGATEAEAAGAAKKIGMLLGRYNLEMTEVQLDAENYVKRSFSIPGRRNAHPVQYCHNMVAEFCDCINWVSPTYDIENDRSQFSFYFFGTETDTLMAVHLMQTIYNTMENALVNYKKSADYELAPSKRSATVSFRKGFANGVRKRLADIKAQRDREAEDNRKRLTDYASGDLIALRKKQKVDSEFKKTGMKLRTRQTSSSVGDGSGYNAGRNASSSVNLNRPIQGGGKGVKGYLT